MKSKISIGIVAHVDAGKTTLTEQLLFVSGAIKTPGSVDEGTAKTDRLAVEKQRGISVRSAYTSMQWNDTEVFLVDTPGHVDFSAEVERVLSVIDVAVLVISAVEGIQAHTETLWRVLKEVEIPVLIFINKTDRTGADSERVMDTVYQDFTESFVVLNKAEGEGSPGVMLSELINQSHVDESILEALANVDDHILECFLGGKAIEAETVQQHLRQAFRNHLLTPVILGSAKNGLGINLLLDTIVSYAKNSTSDDDELLARVFGIESEPGKEKVAHVKLFKGTLNPRDLVKNISKNTEEKVNRMRKNCGADQVEVKTAFVGDIVNVYGLKDAGIGDWLGNIAAENEKLYRMQPPLLTVQIKPLADKDYTALAAALELMSAESPELGFSWNRDDKEFHLQVMGRIQMEVIELQLRDRFGIEAQFDKPTVIYKETISEAAYGFAEYTMPKPCWAVVKFKLEPGQRGSGVVYSSEVSVDKIQRKYQNEVANAIGNALKQGAKGWEVTDIRITLVDGEDHEMHSRPGDFIIATNLALMEGLHRAGTTLLEPVLQFKIEADEALLGSVAGDITQMRGTIDSPHIADGKFVLTGTVPLSESMDYPIALSSRSGGKAKLSTRLREYRPCTPEQGAIRAYKGVSPLDRSKYILKMRNALQ